MLSISWTSFCLCMDALSSRSTDLLPFSNCFKFMNFYKSVTNSLNIWEFIDLLRIWLKCHPVEEIQEINDINSATFIDFNSGTSPRILQDLDALVFLEIELSSMFIRISSFLIILENSTAKIARLIITETMSIFTGRCEYLFITHI